jgi:hypothetical protein
LTAYLDSDGSGDIDYEEFSKKVNFNDVLLKSNKYTISEVSFLNQMVKSWQLNLVRERNKITSLFKKHDKK